jgi:small subunit ribosomal protein S21
MLQDGETVENALRRFKKKVLQENIIGEVKRHAFYLKPGQKLRVKQALARKRNRKKARRELVVAMAHYRRSAGEFQPYLRRTSGRWGCSVRTAASREIYRLTRHISAIGVFRQLDASAQLPSDA